MQEDRICSQVNNTVVVTRCLNYSQPQIDQALLCQLEQLGITRLVRRSDSVLIKPNMIAPRPAGSAVQTHPAVVAGLARAMVDLGARVVVADSPAWGTVYTCARATGLDELLRPIGVAIKSLDQPVRCRLKDGTRVGISTLAFEADLIINVPKFKSHQQVMFTFAVKNIFGFVPGKAKPFWHLARGDSPEMFCGFLINLCRFVGPQVTIIDAVLAMEGRGPINGRPRTLGYIVGARHPIASELVCSMLLGIDPQQVPMIRAAKREDYWPQGEIDIRTDLPIVPCRDFDIPAIVPIRFSPLRVLQSLIKGLWIKIKARWGNYG